MTVSSQLASEQDMMILILLANTYAFFGIWNRLGITPEYLTLSFAQEMGCPDPHEETNVQVWPQ
jgi:hypothetical protein